MKIYCMSDIHGYLREFNEALSLVEDRLNDDTMLLLLGDYVHDGYDSYGVLDRIMDLQKQYGDKKVVALRGNHEEMIVKEHKRIEDDDSLRPGEEIDEKYMHWLRHLKYHYEAGNTIFVHAGIDEEAGDLWKVGTPDYIFVEKFPASKGWIEDLDMTVVAGHIGTASIAGDSDFHGIYYDGASHYYIDGSTKESHHVNILMVDTDVDEYYEVTADGMTEVRPYKKKKKKNEKK